MNNQNQEKQKCFEKLLNLNKIIDFYRIQSVSMNTFFTCFRNSASVLPSPTAVPKSTLLMLTLGTLLGSICTILRSTRGDRLIAGLNEVNPSSIIDGTSNPGRSLGVRDPTKMFLDAVDFTFLGNPNVSPLLLWKEKIVVCWIPKNSCTKYKQLALKVDGQSDWEKGAHISRPHLLLGHQSRDTVQQITMDESWKKVAIIRDPVDRFLSAYMDKMVNECLLKELNARGNGTCFLATVDDLRYFLHLDFWKRNDHFSFQYNFCGFSKFASIWNSFILFGDKMANSSYITFGERLSDELMYTGFPGGKWFEMGIGHETKCSSAMIDFIEEICQDPTILREIRMHLELDYTFFLFPQHDICARIRACSAL